MPSNVRFVQFPHPGREHSPDFPGGKRWSPTKLSHGRKFLSLEGSAVASGTRRDGPLWAWAEWEPESGLIRDLDQPDGRFPRYLWNPYYRCKDNYAQLHNTDPFVFGGFYYADCKQGASPALEGLKKLGPGSVILFGSATPRWQSWVLDTVFVVRDFMDYDRTTAAERLSGLVPDAYRDVVLRPTFDNPEHDNRARRLYRGATYDAPFEGMFSFFPCTPPGVRGFPRPPVTLPAPYFTDGLKQGAKGHALGRPSLAFSEVKDLWERVRDQVESRGLELGVAAAVPPRRE